MLTNEFVSFEQLGPDLWALFSLWVNSPDFTHRYYPQKNEIYYYNKSDLSMNLTFTHKENLLFHTVVHLILVGGFEPSENWNKNENKMNCNVRKCLFVYFEVLRPSQPKGVMSSAVSLHNHTFTGQA